MLAIKTGNHKSLPHNLLYKLFISENKPKIFEDDLIEASDEKEKFGFDFKVENQKQLRYELVLK
jgi:hypothetical protein